MPGLPSLSHSGLTRARFEQASGKRLYDLLAKQRYRSLSCLGSEHSPACWRHGLRCSGGSCRRWMATSISARDMPPEVGAKRVRVSVRSRRSDQPQCLPSDTCRHQRQAHHIRSGLIPCPARYLAKRAIVALPPVLTQTIEWSPALPDARIGLASATPMGSVIKCFVQYERPFWRDAGWSGEAFSDGVAGLVMDATVPSASAGTLAVFLLGEQARRHAGKPDDRRRAVLSALIQQFGPDAGHPQHTKITTGAAKSTHAVVTPGFSASVLCQLMGARCASRTGAFTWPVQKPRQITKATWKVRWNQRSASQQKFCERINASSRGNVARCIGAFGSCVLY